MQMSPRRVATIDLPAVLGQSWSQASVYDQLSLRDEDALLLAFRALKRRLNLGRRYATRKMRHLRKSLGKDKALKRRATFSSHYRGIEAAVALNKYQIT
jgi:hypothetical protein